MNVGGVAGLETDVLAGSSPIEQLIGPLGVVRSVTPLNTRGWLPPEVEVYTAMAGNAYAVSPDREDSQGSYRFGGTGRSWGDPGHARLLAVCEAVERYAAAVKVLGPYTIASAEDMGEPAVRFLSSVPLCSARERRRSIDADGLLSVRSASSSLEIRWLAARELISDSDAWVPMVMGALLRKPWPAEYFWSPVSTGCAIHTTKARALLSGLYEVVERDALTLAWLRQIRLPLLDPDVVHPYARRLDRWLRDRGVRTYLFDASTDLGIPVVLCLQTAEGRRYGAQLVAASGGPDVTEATHRAMLEASAFRGSVEVNGSAPRRFVDFSAPIDIAAYMGVRGRRTAFDFLLDLDRPVSSGPEMEVFQSDESELAHMLGIFRRRHEPVYYVDQTVREVQAIGYHAGQVLIPALQPMSLHPLIQYRSHSRLQIDTRSYGRDSASPEHLNPFPQPMA